MEYEVTLKIKTDPDYFYLDTDVNDRQYAITEQIRNALYDLDDVTVTRIVSEEVSQ